MSEDSAGIVMQALMLATPLLRCKSTDWDLPALRYAKIKRTEGSRGYKMQTLR